MEKIYILTLVSFTFFFSFSAEATPPSGTFDSFINQGFDALRSRNTYSAKQHFSSAKKLGKGPQKKYARHLIRKIRYFEDYFSRLRTSERYLERKQFKLAVDQYERARYVLQRSADHYPVSELDEAFQAEAKDLINTTEEKRKEAFQMAVALGEELILDEKPAKALKEFSYAKEQMHPDEYKKMNISFLLEDAQVRVDYSKYLEKGEMHLDDGKLHEALQWFVKAKQKRQTTEVRDLIFQTESLLSEAYLSEGESYYTIGAYEKALTSFNKSMEYIETEETIQWVNQTTNALYLKHLDLGDQLVIDKKYIEGIKAYQKAKGYKDNREVMDRIQRATDLHYLDLKEAGQEAVEEGKFELALKKFKLAQALKGTPEIKEKITQTEEMFFQQLLVEGTLKLKEAAFEDALSIINKAEKFKSTPELSQLKKDAEVGLKYQNYFQAGQNHLEENNQELALDAFKKAREMICTPEVEEQIDQLEARFATYRTLVSMGTQAQQTGDLEDALEEYQKAKGVVNNDEIRVKIQQTENALNQYAFHMKEGRSTYDRQEVNASISHFEKAINYNDTEEAQLWLNRAHKMPCSISVRAYGNESKIGKAKIELVDFYTLELLFTAKASVNKYVFPKVQGGKDHKYYLRTYLKEDDSKISLSELECDCSGDKRKLEFEVNIE